jgi:hypothetical protein
MYKELLANLDDAQLMDLFKIILQEGANRKLEKEFREIETDEREMANITHAAYQAEYNRQVKIQKDLAVETAKKQAAADAAAKFGTQPPSTPKNENQVIWEKRKAIAKVIENIGLSEDIYWELNTWERSDKRLYFNNTSNTAVATYYHTGTNSKPPQSISFNEGIKKYFPNESISKQQKQQLKQLFTAICNNWISFSMDNSSIDDFDGEADPQTLAKYLKAIEIPTK